MEESDSGERAVVGAFFRRRSFSASFFAGGSLSRQATTMEAGTFMSRRCR
jgi:hypothetical protein